VQKGNMMKQLQQMQSRMAKIQEELDELTVVGTAGGGAVSITVNGHQKVLAITIDPEASSEGMDMLADMVMAACNDAMDRSRAQAAEQMGALTAGMGLPPGLL
jgi:DNA-binding YbaB/EbfC family protein